MEIAIYLSQFLRGGLTTLTYFCCKLKPCKFKNSSPVEKSLITIKVPYDIRTPVAPKIYQFLKKRWDYAVHTFQKIKI